MNILKTNLIDWTIYSIIAAIPFFGGSEEVVELITNEMVKWTIDNVGNPDAKSSEKFDEIMKKYKDDE